MNFKSCVILNSPNEQPNAKSIGIPSGLMPGSNTSAGLDAGPNQLWCGAGSVLDPDFWEILTSLI